MKRSHKLLSLILTICIAMSMLPGFAPANAVTTVTTTAADSEVFELPDIVDSVEAKENDYVGRVEAEEKDLYTFVFANGDGTNTMRIYSHPVKYVADDGSIRDISLDIEAKRGGGFVTADHEIITTFESKLTEGVSLEYNDIELTLVPAPGTGVAPTAELSSDGKVVTYEMNDNTSFVYELTYAGFKEDIVVEEYTGQTEYEFTLFTNGLTLCEEYGSYYLADAEGNIEATIGDIIVFTADERNNTMGSMTYETVRANQEYVLTIHLDADYLADEDTVYPIRIDPTIEINYDNNGAGAIEDVTINQNSTFSGTSGSLYVGRHPAGSLSRVLMRFPNLSLSGISANQITAATVEIRDLMCQGDEDITVECRIYSAGSPSWSEAGTTTWSSVGTAYLGSLLDSHVISYGQGNVGNHRYSFDIIMATRLWATGKLSPSKGLVFKANSAFENQTGDAVETWYKTFASYNRSSNQPSLTISYTVNPTSVTISPTTASATVGGSDYTGLTATVLPSYANDKTVIWASSNTDVAQVDASTGVVTPIAPGKVSITCTTSVGEIPSSNKCTFTVEPSASSYSVMSLGVTYDRMITLGRHYWFYFTPTETGVYTFESSGTTDTYGSLYMGSAVLHSDDDDGVDNNFKLSYRLTANVRYRFLVKGYGDIKEGSCTVKVIKGWPETAKPSINPRSSWNARNVIEDRLSERTRAPERLIFHHSADKFDSTDYDDTVDEIQRIQDFHMDDEEKCDIAYHFIIDPAGRIWQGAEIDDYKRGHATNYYDDIGVLVLGDFESRAQNLWNPNILNQAQKNAMETLAKWLCYEYNLSINTSSQTAAPINTHRRVNPGGTVCPGDNAAEWIENDLQPAILNWRM